jgi:hypothetical protein
MMMRKYIKNGYLNGLIFFLCSSSVIYAFQINCSFNHLFPMTWYQKGLESSLYVWHTLSELFEKNDGLALPYDLLLGKLVFTQFCVDSMIQEGVVCMPEDSAYFAMVLDKIQSLLALIIVTEKTYDFIACARSILCSIQKQLQLIE